MYFFPNFPDPRHIFYFKPHGTPPNENNTPRKVRMCTEIKHTFSYFEICLNKNKILWKNLHLASVTYKNDFMPLI